MSEEIEINENLETIPQKTRKKSEIGEWIQAIIIAIILTVLVRSFLFTVVLVEGASMEPTLHTGDRLFAVKVYGELEYGDVVVFKPKNSPTKPYIKRVIAKEGQVVDIDYYTSEVLVDGKRLDEPFIKEEVFTLRGDLTLPVKVPAGSIFVMGDNRNNSHDSRSVDVGLVDKKSLIGKAVFRIWPFGNPENLKVEKIEK